ncbi:pyridoxamine 5'-phosphate oxidase [Variibacter gotjawalensis]|uniref:Pyridoxamine 5'-phosphate oxidase n=1 Tax=Variibacter gotjawalensis TaxID=1333996 RepID=A0A0S3PZB5_9BRAD|nr:pyridoxamine 5'-phosphate oxidase family protein [Variibacter gotjawalensis]NIK47110.1 hypothetical protein [Variibacter gotjawalensis]RZS49012.1 hypothetical protein EV661_1436 [Variibacter gotjawalensis]BAT61272.1 pyridoxamine 5'-phosphate oxidase [Variibacter gotjawalensis]
MSDGIPTESFPITPRNRVKRLHERGSYDKAAVYAILDAAMLCHVSYAIDGQPYCTPTLFWRDGDRLYWHGSSASRMLRTQKGGVPVCLTVSHLDGLVLARSGFNHSANYRAAMCFGTASIIDDPEEKVRGLADVINRFYPGRAETLRQNTAQEIKATTIIGMTIEDASAKVRSKGVGDDEEDYGFAIWAGVIPVETVIRAEQDCPRILPGKTRPDNVAAYTDGRRLDAALTETHKAYETLK